MDLGARFKPFFPIGGGLVRLEVVEPGAGPTDGGPERGTVVLMMIIFEERPEGRIVRDVKEQQLSCGPAALYTDTSRVDEMLYAQQEVLGEVLRGLDEAETLMPHDLFFANVMTLARARTRDDFAKALRAKSRLGRYLAR